jgi:CPA1 family monovalent cation:H+ antiporter
MEPLLHLLAMLALASPSGLAARCIPFLPLSLLLRRRRDAAGVSVPREERWARTRALRAGLACLEAQQRYPQMQGPGPLLDRVAGEYRQRLGANYAFLGGTTSRELPPREIRVRLQALSAERSELLRLRLTHRINDATFQRLSSRLDLDKLYLRRRTPHTK